jgi:hypothetical protein
MPDIITKIEGRRGCGYRQPGGLYLVADGRGQHCDKLPIELTVCPCCGEGIKFSRGFTWITGALFASAECSNAEQIRTDLCFECPFSDIHERGRYGLMWVGEKFYSAAEFTLEAARQGISKRIAQIPRDFKIGETWIVLAHIKAIRRDAPVMVDGNAIGSAPHWFPGIFHAFRPQRIEYVVTGKETDEQLNAYVKRGFTLVRVIRDIDTQQPMTFPAPDE